MIDFLIKSINEITYKEILKIILRKFVRFCKYLN